MLVEDWPMPLENKQLMITRRPVTKCATGT